MTLQGRKTLMIVDNCPAHPKVDGLQSVELLFLPPNCTSVLQPMDQGIIRVFKSHYRKLCLKMIIEHIDQTGTRPKEQLNVLQAMEFVKRAWTNVSSEAIHNCYLHGFHGSALSAQSQPPTEELTSMLQSISTNSAKEDITLPTPGKTLSVI